MSTSSDASTNFINFLNNDYTIAVLAILAFAYGQHAMIQLPQFIVDLFSNTLFRVLYLSLLLIARFETRPTVALIIALVFIYMLQYIHIKECKETMANIEKYKNMKH
jgi:uncharacterized protein YqhQ